MTFQERSRERERAQFVTNNRRPAACPAVLQLCRSGLICCANAPCFIGFRSVQVEAIRTGSHPSGGWLVSAFFLVVPGRRGVARRARSARRSRHGVALGPAVCPRNGTTFALYAQTDQRQLASGRNLHP